MTRNNVLWQTALLLISIPLIKCNPLTPSQPTQARSSCDYPYPEHCYVWTSLPSDNALSCDLDSVQQITPNAVLDPCPGWFREFSLYPYRFQILPFKTGAEPEGKIYSQFAQSKCYVKAAPNSVYPNRKSATMRSAAFRPNGCIKLQTTFWYRMSAAPILTGDRDKDNFLELVVHHSADNASGFIPDWQIWGSLSDYADFPGPNVWARVQTEYAADDQFTLNFYAHHGDTCNTTSIDIDGIDTRIAVPSPPCTAFPTTTPSATDHTDCPSVEPLWETSTPEPHTADTSTASTDHITDPAHQTICPLPSPCYSWKTLRACDMGTTTQVAGNSTGILACSSPPAVTWYRGYRYFPFQFDLVDGDTADVGVIAVSRCIKRTFGLPADRSDAVAILRGPIIIAPTCTVYRVTFWYRLSHYPTIDSANPRGEFVFKVSLEVNWQIFPNDQIWGSATDYIGVNLNQWHFGQAVFGRDRGEQFTVNFLAYHNDDCEANVKTIALDDIIIQEAVSDSEDSGICSPIATTPRTTTTRATPTSTATRPTMSTTTTAETYFCTCPTPPDCTTVPPTADQVEAGPAVVARCINGTVTIPFVQPELSNAVEAVFDGDNSYLCRTHLRNLHWWLMGQSGRSHELSSWSTRVTCHGGVIEFSENNPDTAPSSDLQLRAASLDSKCRGVFAGFLTQMTHLVEHS